VRRGSLIVIPIGRALLYAEPIFLQASRSPMPELRIVVLAMQERLVYGATFEEALTNLLAGSPAAPSTQTSEVQSAIGKPPVGVATARAATDLRGLISEAARDLADYQRLTAEGKLGEAGQKLESLKYKLEELQRRK
jgi:uncharacterized membrane protein (UPF0182 family)